MKFSHELIAAPDGDAVDPVAAAAAADPASAVKVSPRCAAAMNTMSQSAALTAATGVSAAVGCDTAFPF